MTIIDAIRHILIEENKPLSIKEIYEKIIDKDLYEFKAKNPQGVVAGLIRRHCQGIDFPSSSPLKYFNIIEKDKYNLVEKTNQKELKLDFEKKVNHHYSKEKLPEEMMQDAYFNHIKSLEQQLIEIILQSPPVFFEILVIKLLLKMGYGKQGSSEHTGKTNDGGIDGVIFQDSLGLDRIYIQAKRYSDSSIGRPDIQQFVGALENITKGVFITTSKFTKEAKEYAQKQQQKNLVLIDGEKLTSLMIQYRVGIQDVATYTTYKIDSDYFSIA